MMNTDTNIKAVSYTDIGKVRTRNEDAIFLNPSAKLFGVCDGMGGLRYGKEAAELVAKYLSSENVFIQDDREETTCLSEIDQLKSVISNINMEIGFKNYKLYVRYGCTLCGIWFVSATQALVFNLGDSRCYIFRNKECLLEKITYDHTKAQQIIDSKSDVVDEVILHARHVLTRYVGNPQKNDPDIFQVNYELGDRFLLCTDGLYNEVNEQEIETILYNYFSKEISEFGGIFVEKALTHGGKDNISLIILQPMIKE